MGKELLRIGAPFQQPEWSALALMEDPDSVLRAHRNFIEAGADVIITNVYAVVPYHLGEERFAARGAELASLAARLARQAADEAPHAVRVAGSLPPLFGSYEPWDYRPEDGPAIYDMLVRAQADLVDFWVGETTSSIQEARAIIDATTRGPGPDELWLSFCLHNEPSGPHAELVSRELLSDAIDATVDDVAAVLFNCCRPEAIQPALAEVAAAVTPRPLGAYANAFVANDEAADGYHANEVILEHREDITPASYADLCQLWMDSGATIIGGCCGIYPQHIAELSQRFGQTPEGAS